ncbi:hypothetical protein [uncultured Winogradskyella sp.]|uniref:hypothetical protein n=1 Tax=uncultured Winogradskyella sp. TaxID=395353 RepID=UPI0035149A3C
MTKLKINLNNVIFKSTLYLIYIKLIFSYLTVKHGWWLRDVPTNAERFNFLGVPENLSNQVEFLLIPLLFSYILWNYRRVKRLGIVLLVIFLMFLINLITAQLNEVRLIDSITFSLKIVTPILFFYAFLIFYKDKPDDAKKTVIQTITLCLTLTILGLLFFHHSMNRTTEQWPIFFAGIHTHSYILASIFIGIAYLLYREGSRLVLAIFLLLSFSCLHLGYNVRTATILYLLFLSAVLYLLHDLFKYLVIKLAVFVPLFVMLLFLIYDSDTLNKFSSGRLNMYAEKFEMLSLYNFLEILFGRGYGSDFNTTESWWWAEKGSHSDFLTFFIENGIIFLGFFTILPLLLIYNSKKPNILILSLVLSYYLSSLISNGLAIRPIAAYVFFMVFSFIALTTHERQTLYYEE